MAGILITVGVGILTLLYVTFKHAKVLSDYAPKDLDRGERAHYISNTKIGNIVTTLAGWQWIEIFITTTVFSILFGLGVL